MNLKPFFLIFLLILSSYTQAKTYYVATNGDDSQDGITLETSFATVSKAIGKVTAGDTIFVRGGQYAIAEKISISISGKPTQHIYLWAYPGEYPVLDFSTQPEGSSNRGIQLSAKYWHIKGFEVANAKDNGLIISAGHYNTVEQCVFHNNKDTGLQISSGSSYNDIINCDSYFNADVTYENADGFAAKLDIGPGIRFVGCRSWNNSDDGWDLYEGQFPVVIDHCWSFYNGYLEDSTIGVGSGDMNGFKVGGNYVAADHVVTNCLAFRNGAKGFDQNHNTGNCTLINNIAWQNGKVKNKPNYSFSDGDNVFKNNISYESTTSDIHNGSIQEHNSWQGFEVTADDFISFDTSLVRLPRMPDGSLPEIDFLHLVLTSDMVNAGVDAGIPFSGDAPNLGPFDYDNAGNRPEYVLLNCWSSYMGQIHPGTGLYLKDAEIQIIAQPKGGFLFSTWGGDLSGVEDTVFYTLSKSSTFWAEFIEDTTSRVAERKINRLQLYPNPCIDEINFLFDNKKTLPFELRIFDAMGRLQSLEIINARDANLGFHYSVRHLKSGFYFINVTNKQESFSSSFQVVK